MSEPIKKTFLSLTGRRNRLSYFLFSLTLLGMLFVVILMGVLDTMLAPSVLPAEFESLTLDEQMELLVGSDNRFTIFAVLQVFAAFLLIPHLIVYLFVGAQRCRDFGWTGWAVLLTLIPLLGKFFWLAMFLIPGTQGENRYGSDPSGAQVSAS